MFAFKILCIIQLLIDVYRELTSDCHLLLKPPCLDYSCLKEMLLFECTGTSMVVFYPQLAVKILVIFPPILRIYSLHRTRAFVL